MVSSLYAKLTTLSQQAFIEDIMVTEVLNSINLDFEVDRVKIQNLFKTD